jgi:hypothetical protein
MLRHVALVRTDISEELGASFISVRRLPVQLVLFLVTDSCHPDEGGSKFLRNVCSYKSQMALPSQKTLSSRKVSVDLIGTQTHDLLACSIMLQHTPYARNNNIH